METRTMTNRFGSFLRASLCGVALSAALAACAGFAPAGASGGRSFETPEEAVRALAALAGSGDFAAGDEILGPGSMDLLRSGDDAADRADALRVRAMIDRKLGFENVGEDRRIALLGDDEWPFALPLVREGGRWRFDVEAGREELANRRVGRNELRTIATLHAFVDAQREYQAEPRDGNPRSFASKIVSTEGRRDGLFWPARAGEPESPLGPEVAAAAAEGYRPADGSMPAFHGYRYRILHRQGPNAAGGVRSYADAQGRLTGGFAAVAWPVRHGVSGVKSFLVSDRGIVFEKDLGPDTAETAAAIDAYDPDASWEPVAE